MAESVKRRVAAARLAVAFVAAGTIAGATAWAQAGPPPTAHASLLVSSLKLDSHNIKNGSLLLQDFKQGQVPSEDSFLKLKTQTNSFKSSIKGELGDLKTEASNVNGDLGSIKGELGDIKGELGGFLKSADADGRYIKLGASVVEGDGSVHTATGMQNGSDPVTLLDLSGLISVVGLQGNKIQITNNSGGPLTHTACPSGPQGGTVPAGVLNPGDTLTCDGSVSQLLPAVQLIGAGGKPVVMTLNFSSIDFAKGGPAGSQDTVQILIGL